MTPPTDITASVSQPTPIPERPTLYAVAYLDPRGNEWHVVGGTCITPRTNLSAWPPGCVLVTIPGSAAPVEKPMFPGVLDPKYLFEEDSTPVEKPAPAREGLEWEVWQPVSEMILGAFRSNADAEAWKHREWGDSSDIEVRRRPAAKEHP